MFDPCASTLTTLGPKLGLVTYVLAAIKPEDTLYLRRTHGPEFPQEPSVEAEASTAMVWPSPDTPAEARTICGGNVPKVTGSGPGSKDTSGGGCCMNVGGFVVGSTRKIAVLVTKSALLPFPKAIARGMFGDGGDDAAGTLGGMFTV